MKPKIYKIHFSEVYRKIKNATSSGSNVNLYKLPGRQWSHMTQFKTIVIFLNLGYQFHGMHPKEIIVMTKKSYMYKGICHHLSFILVINRI